MGDLGVRFNVTRCSEAWVAGWLLNTMASQTLKQMKNEFICYNKCKEQKKIISETFINRTVKQLASVFSTHFKFSYDGNTRNSHHEYKYRPNWHILGIWKQKCLGSASSIDALAPLKGYIHNI